MIFRFFAGGSRYEGAASSLNVRFMPAVAPDMAKLGATAIPGMNLLLAQRVRCEACYHQVVKGYLVPAVYEYSRRGSAGSALLSEISFACVRYGAVATAGGDPVPGWVVGWEDARARFESTELQAATPRRASKDGDIARCDCAFTVRGRRLGLRATNVFQFEAPKRGLSLIAHEPALAQ